MTYELFVVSIVILMIYRKQTISLSEILNEKRDYEYRPFNYIIVFSFLVILILSLTNSEVRNQFNFIMPSAFNTARYNNNYEYYAKTSTIVKLLGILFNLELSAILIEMITHLYKKYKEGCGSTYAFLIFILAFFNVAIYQGSNRSAMMMKGLATIFILLILFSNHRKIIIQIFGTLLIAIIVAISLSRNHDVFSSMNAFAKALNGYFAGPENVALSVHMYNLASSNLKPFMLAYDFIRPVLGLGTIFRSQILNTSPELFNIVIYGFKEGSYILPFIGQGYFYFGFIFAPMLETIFIIIAHSIEKRLFSTRSFVATYFYIFICTRMGFFSVQNFYVQINALLPMLVFAIFLTWFNRSTVNGVNIEID